MMKKNLALVLIISFCFVGSLQAEKFYITTTVGKTYKGDYVSRTDSTLTIYDSSIDKNLVIKAQYITQAYSPQGGNFEFINGKLVGQTYEEIYHQRVTRDSILRGDPNYAIAHAMKATGGISLGVGIPSLLAGAILVTYGLLGQNAVTEKIYKSTDVKAITNLTTQLQQYSNCTTAGCVLLPFGGALTIIGVPLIVHGNRIMDLSLQVSENGPGIAVKF